MADRVEYFAVTVPRGVAKSKPQTTKIGFREGIVREVEILVPPGPSGFMGFRLLQASTALIPFTRDSWIVSDSEVIRWPLGSAIESGDWSIQMYNEGVYQHTIQVRFLVDEVGSKVGVAEGLGLGVGIGEAAPPGGGLGEVGDGLPSGEPTPPEGEAPEPEAEPEAEPPEGPPEPEEQETSEPESPEPGEPAEVSSGEPSKEISGWVAAAFWHGKGHKRRLWWFYGTAAAAERYRKSHHLKWVFYGTLAQGKAWQRKHVKAEHKPPHGRKPRSFKAEGAQLLRAEKHPAKPKAKPHPPRQPSPRHPQKPPPKPKARPPARARPAAPPPPQRKRHR